MSCTLDELMERLAERLDPEEILELLQITTEELVGAFEDKIRENFDRLEEEMYGE